MAENAKWTPGRRKTVEQFRAWLTAESIGQNRAAKLLGIRAATLSQMLSCTYPGAVDRICERMTRHLRRMQLRALAPERPPYATTSITEQVVEGLTIAQVERVIVLVLGPTGCGKTMGLRRYCEENPDAIYIVGGIRCSPYIITQKLADALKLDVQDSMARMHGGVVEALRDSGRLVIVDEIDYLAEPALQELRMIHDDAGVGMAWAGTYSYLTKLRERKSGRATIRQVLGRIQYTVQIDRCSADDLAQILSHYDLRNGSLEALIEGANGEARRAVAAAVAAQRIAGKAREITTATVLEAYDTLMPPEIALPEEAGGKPSHKKRA